MKIILSLCDYSGKWPSPYLEHGYGVLCVDPKHTPGFDSPFACRGNRNFTFSGTAEDVANDPYAFILAFSHYLEEPVEVHGILAAPPCTDFTVSGAQYWPAKDADGRTAASLAIVDACLHAVETLTPQWWALENPVGRLPKLRPNLGQPRIYVDPWMFAGFAPEPEQDRYTKKTGLWGNFNADLPRAPLEPIRVCAQGSWIQRLGGKSERTKELRSMTPLGLSVAFSKANP